MHEASRSVALSDDRLIRRLVKFVAELDLDCRDFVIFGSGPLLAHGLRRHIQDLGVVARGAVWCRVSQYGFPAVGSINGAPMAVFWGGLLIQFSPGWISEDWDTDDLIDRAEIIEGLPFAQLTDVLEYKQMLGRPKDRPDIQALVQLLRQQGNGLVAVDSITSERRSRSSHGVARKRRTTDRSGRATVDRDSLRRYVRVVRRALSIPAGSYCPMTTTGSDRT
jgi:hypothetical protein